MLPVLSTLLNFHHNLADGMFLKFGFFTRDQR